MPSDIAIDASGRFAYVAELGDELGGTFAGDVRQMAIALDGSVSYLPTASLASVLHPTAIVAHPSLGFVYVGGHGPDGIAQYSVGGDGQLVPLSPAFAAMPNNSAIAALDTDPSGTWLYALGYAFNGSPVVCFRIEADGTLTQLGHDFAAPWGASMTVAPDGLHVWTSTTYDNGFTLKPEIRSFSNDGLGGVDWVASFGASNYYFGLAVSPSGGAVYAVHYVPTGGGDVKSFAVGVNGALTEFGTPPATGDYPDGIAITADGNWLYVANRDDDTICQYAVNGDDTLTALSPTTATATQPSALCISPDGQFLFATNFAGTGAAGNLVTALVIGANGELSDFHAITWSDLGSGLAGVSGIPTLSGAGDLLASSTITLALANAKPFSFAPLVVGVSSITAPFKGGTMVPNPDFIFPLFTDFFGGATFGGLWPSGVPSGLSTYFQWWVQDPVGPKGFAASNALAGTTP